MTGRKRELSERHSVESRALTLELFKIMEIKSQSERSSRLLEFLKKQRKTYARMEMEGVLLDLPFYFGHYLDNWSWVTKSRS